jgi:NTP pyrophosphatase (non-canonical NTP hydrolase)
MDVNDKILEWANQRNLLPGDPNKQFVKLIEEIGELANGMSKNNHAEIIDAIGDIQVVLIILSNQLGVDYKEALKEAYNVIKSRTGKTVNGIFIKD